MPDPPPPCVTLCYRSIDTGIEVVQQYSCTCVSNITLAHACREWRAQLQVVLDSQGVGMLRLETGALKATYTNTLSSAQATIAMLMVVAGRRAAQAAIDKLQTVSR
jgi:hypothetical protein